MSSAASIHHPMTFPYINTAEVITLGSILPAVCLIVVALRFSTRIRQRAGLGLDDWLILPGLVLFIGMSICLLIGATQAPIGDSVGSDVTRLRIPWPLESYLLSTNELMAKLEFAFQIMLVIGYGFIKVSIVSLYRRIFVTERNGSFDLISKGTLCMIVAWSLTFLILTIISCGSDIAALWGGQASQAEHCTIAFSGAQGLADTDLVLDVWLMLLPQPIVWRLKLSMAKKAMVSGIFFIGLSCIGASIARIVLFVQIENAANAAVPLDQNQIITLSMWYSALDGGLAIIAACLPTLRPLFKGMTVRSFVNNVKSSLSVSSASSGRGENHRLWPGYKSTKSSSSGYRDVEKGMNVTVKECSMTPLMSTPLASPALR